MEPTITQSGALFEVQHRAAKRRHRRPHDLRTETPGAATATLRTSVGEFAFRRARVGVYLELIVGKVRRVLGLYKTNEAAVHALKDRRTGFRTWDTLERKAAANQLGTRTRWDSGH